MKKILIIPPQPWYMLSHYEYIIRYLSDEFFIEQAYVPYPPYEDFLNRFPNTSPLERNPNDYDLLLPVWAQQWGVANNIENGKKTAVVQYEPGEGAWINACYLGVTTPIAEENGKTLGKPMQSVRFGIDTKLFKPYEMLREDDLLHVGIVGNHSNPRHMMGEVLPALYDLPGVRVMIFPVTWTNQGGDAIEFLGGRKFLDHCVAGDKSWPGLPNIYNRLDVLLRVDTAYGYSFPTLEAAACGVPVITTYQGIDHLITEAGGGILLGTDRWSKDDGAGLAKAVREAVIWMRDHPEERKTMGNAGRVEIEKNWTWEKHVPNWRKFFRNALEVAA